MTGGHSSAFVSSPREPSVQNHLVQQRLQWRRARNAVASVFLCNILHCRLWCKHAWHSHRTTRQHFDPRVLKSTQVFRVLAVLIEVKTSVEESFYRCHVHWSRCDRLGTKPTKIDSNLLKKEVDGFSEIALSCTRCIAHCLYPGNKQFP